MKSKQMTEEDRAALCSSIGKRIKTARIRAEITRKHLSVFLNCSYSAVTMWEIGQRFPNVSDIYDMSSLFKCRLEDLLPATKTGIPSQRIEDILNALPRDGQRRVRNVLDQELAVATNKFDSVTENMTVHDDGSISFERTAQRKRKSNTAVEPRKLKRA